MAEEGVVQLFFRTTDRARSLASSAPCSSMSLPSGFRLTRIAATFEISRFESARWIAAKSPAERDGFMQAHPASMARDLYGAPVFLAASAFDLKYEQDKWLEIVFSDIKNN